MGIRTFLAKLVGEQNNYVIPKVFVDLLDGDYVAAVVLKECVYWSGRHEDDRDGWFYRNEADWQEHNRLSRKQVNRAITAINTVAGGTLIEKQVHQLRSPNGTLLQERATHYRIDPELLAELLELAQMDVSDRPHEGGASHTGSSNLPKGTFGTDPNGSFHNKTTETDNGDGQHSHALARVGEFTPAQWFEHFWSRYPRKTAKEDARKAWNRLAPDETLYQEIIHAVDLFKQTTWAGKEIRFVPHPATFLNGKRWLDEPLPPATQREGGMSIEELLAFGDELEAKGFTV